MLSLQMAKFCIHLHQKDEDNNVGDLHKQQWKTRTNTDASWRSHERGKYNHPKPTSRVHLTRCRRSSSSRCPAHLCPIRSGMTDNYLSYDTKQKHISNTHTHTQCSEDRNNKHTADCPKELASLTNTYAESVNTLGQCTTCTIEAGTNKISTPNNKLQQCWSLYLQSSYQLLRASHCLFKP